MREYSIGTLSRKSGVSVKAIRFYTDRGLLPPAHVAPSGYRYYTDGELARLHQIIGLRWLGVSLHQIDALLADQMTLADVLAAQKASIAAELDRLRRLEGRLSVAEQALRNGEEALWSHLYQLREMMQVTAAERREWLEQWWRRQLVGKVPPEVLDTFIQKAKTMVTDEEPSPLAAAMWAGMRDGQLPGFEQLPGQPKDAGLNTQDSWAEWATRWRTALAALKAVSALAPEDPSYQTALRQWVGCHGPVTTETVERCLKDLDSPAAEMFAALDTEGAIHLGVSRLQEGLRYLQHTLAR